MENFQKEIRDYLGVAVPGTLVEAAESYKLLEHFVTEDDTCTVGGFVKKGSVDGKVTGAAGDGAVLGIIIKDSYFTGQDLGMSIPAGQTVTVCVFGVVAVENTYSASASVNNKVFIKSADGTLAFSDSDVADAKNTGWAVKQGAESGGIAFIVR